MSGDVDSLMAWIVTVCRHAQTDVTNREMVRIYLVLREFAFAGAPLTPLRRWLAGPADTGKSDHPAGRHSEPFGRQQRPLEREIGISAELTVGGDHAMVGQASSSRLAQDVADRARRTGPPGQARDIAVGGDAANRNARHHREHLPLERGHCPNVNLTRKLVPPRSVSPNTAETPDSPMAFGTVVHAASPATPSQRRTRISNPPST